MVEKNRHVILGRALDVSVESQGQGESLKEGRKCTTDKMPWHDKSLKSTANSKEKSQGKS